MPLAGQIRDDSVPDIDDDRNSAPPPHPFLLQLETEAYEKLEHAMERAGYSKSDTALIFMEIAMRKDQFRIALGKGFENPLEGQNSFEKASLKKLFNALRGHSWTKKFGWTGLTKTSQTPEVRMFAASSSLYEGVSLARIFENVGIMTAIELDGFGCDGEIPEDVENFETTKKFTLKWNDIRGFIPKGLRGMTAIQELNLSGNNLSGKLDTEVFSALKHAVIIDLSSNNFTGNIPSCFTDMKFLKEIDLSNNQFTGGLPFTISKVAGTLEVLKVQKNDLKGEFPPWISALQELTILNLSNNSFGGTINQVWECTKLRRIDLSENELIGTIDEDISRLEDLQILFLHKNRLRGSVPVGICSVMKLQRLNLSYNSFRGSLPRDMGNLIKLESLVLEGNRFIGPTPASFSKLTRLRDFSLYKNISTENGYAVRGFRRDHFERIHIWGPTQGINSTTWEFQSRAGAANPKGETEDRFWLFDARLHRNEKQYS